MLFGSYTFILFFVFVLALHYMPLPWRAKKFNLLWLSYLFYAAWNPPFVLLLMFSTVVDWILAHRIHKARTDASRRAFLWGSLCVNLGMLGFFKYSGFLLENLIWMAAQVGIDYRPAAPDIVLPVGISFYTFQTLSYTLDVYYRRMEPGKSFLDYALYVTFFPQLVAGPIVRAADFLPQCAQETRPTTDRFVWGITLMVLGLFQKSVLADRVFAPVADKIFSAGTVPAFGEAWTGTLAFTGQIFCDFAGYSTCAIGAALCLGFSLPDNFRFPYAAIGFSDFWRRWHISLSSWLRDYLYIPLGGNRKGAIRTDINLMATMLIGGLWHGAAWTFVIWGGLHGACLVAEKFLRKACAGQRIWSTWPLQFSLGAVTFLMVCIAWVFFRAQDLDQAMRVLSGMTDVYHLEREGRMLRQDQAVPVLVTIASLLAAHALLRRMSSLERAVALLPSRARTFLLVLCVAAGLLAIYLNAGDSRAFIYFQF